MPLSVWTRGRDTAGVAAGLMEVYATPGDVVTVIDRPEIAVAAASAGCRVKLLATTTPVSIDATRALADVETCRRALAKVELTDADNLHSRITKRPGEIDLLVAGFSASRRDGWWPSAALGLRVGGHVAIVSDTMSPEDHFALTQAAGNSGLMYTQHIVATDPQDLDNVLAAEDAITGFDAVATHPRVHADVHVFRSPVGGAS